MRIDAAEYQRLDLRALTLLADAPLHDAWAVDLPGGPPGYSILDLRSLMQGVSMQSAGPAASLLWSFRMWLGRVFGWDRAPARAAEQSYVNRLTAADRAATLVAPGTPAGSFIVLFVSRSEAILEIQNATVHGFAVLALSERPDGYRLYIGIHVRPVSRFTGWYMRLIDPFRHLIIYPAAGRAIVAAWTQGQAASGARNRQS